MDLVKEQLKQHILEGVDMSEYGMEDTLENASQTLFQEVIRFDLSLRGSMADKFNYALQGMPNFIHMPFYYKDVHLLMYAIGHEDKNTAIKTYEKLCGEILAESFSYNCAPSPIH